MAEKYKILAVDDEDALRTIVQHELTTLGYEVDVAEDGKVALEMAANKKYDMLILDIFMPNVDGMEVLRQTREKNLAKKVIMLTGVNEMKIARESLALGANDFITKPYDINNLIACINRVMKEA